MLWDLRWDEGTKRKKIETELTMGLLRERKAAWGVRTGCRTEMRKCQAMNGSAVENTYCSCRGHGFESLNPNDSV